jgi:hypothetical protein
MYGDGGDNGTGHGDVIRGCTNPGAINYNPLATVDDGTCVLGKIIPNEIVKIEEQKRKERTDRYAGVSGKRPPKTEAERLAELNKQIDAESLAMIEAQRAKERAKSESLETERGENKTKY